VVTFPRFLQRSLPRLTEARHPTDDPQVAIQWLGQALIKCAGPKNNASVTHRRVSGVLRAEQVLPPYPHPPYSVAPPPRLPRQPRPL
jgi:hypothetical protein